MDYAFKKSFYIWAQKFLFWYFDLKIHKFSIWNKIALVVFDFCSTNVLDEMTIIET